MGESKSRKSKKVNTIQALTTDFEAKMQALQESLRVVQAATSTSTLVIPEFRTPQLNYAQFESSIPYATPIQLSMVPTHWNDSATLEDFYSDDYYDYD